MLDKIPSPCYVIEEEKMRNNLETLKRVKLEAGVEILLAQKAYSNWALYPLISSYLDGAAASSLNEARLAFEYFKKPVHTFSPAFIEEEFEDILAYSSHIIFNSLSQLNRLKHFVRQAKHKKFALRVNPLYSDISTPMYDPVALGSRFGVKPKDLKDLPEYITGLHFHALCENDSFTLQRVLSSFEKHYFHLLPKIEFLNMGGGHFITHPNYDVNHLIHTLQNFKQKYPHLHLIMEPGSAIALNTGFLRTKIVDIINNGKPKTLIIDASITAHMPDCLEMPFQPMIPGAIISSKGNFVYRIGGNSCLSGDFLPEYSFEAEKHVGEDLLFMDQIHYTMVKTSFFNGVNHPSIGILSGSNNFRIIRQFSYEDFKDKLG